MASRFHYDDLVYQHLLHDRLPTTQRESVASHVETCESCQARLESVSQQGVDFADVGSMLKPDELPADSVADTTHPSDKAITSSTTVAFLLPSDRPESLGRFGRYEIDHVLGRGGMGVVLRGFDPALNRYCAIKVLAPELATSAAARARFAREAKSAAAVVHEHVVPIQTVDEERGLPYLVMPAVEGKSLAQRVEQQGPLDVKEVLRIAMQTASGLAAAHAQGLVHRDIKPANILLENGVERVRITDFGLARAVDDANMTQSGVISGTPQYMSPEQARGEEMDCRSDLFSLGSVIYFMCTGRSPFRAETTMGVLNRISHDDPRAIRSINPDVPRWLQEIVERLLSKAPAQRYQSAEEVAEVLGGWLAHLQRPDSVPSPQRVRTSTQRAIRPPRRIVRALLAVAGGLVLLAAGILVVLETNKGTIRVESADKNVTIRILQGDHVYDRLTVTPRNNSLRVGAGEYRIEIEGKHDGLTIENDRIAVTRGDEILVKIVQDQSPGASRRQTPPSDDQWDAVHADSEAILGSWLLEGSDRPQSDMITFMYDGGALRMDFTDADGDKHRGVVQLNPTANLPRIVIELKNRDGRQIERWGRYKLDGDKLAITYIGVVVVKGERYNVPGANKDIGVERTYRRVTQKAPISSERDSVLDVTLRIVDDETGKPVSEYRVGHGVAVPEKETTWFDSLSGKHGVQQTKLGDGVHISLVPHIDPVNYWLRVTAPGYAPHIVDDGPLLRLDGRTVVVRLRRGVTLEATLLSDRGKPVPDAIVYLIRDLEAQQTIQIGDHDGAQALYRIGYVTSTTSDNSGRFVLSGVDAKADRIGVLAPNRSLHVSDIPSFWASELQFKLPQPAELTISVDPADEVEDEYVHVRFMSESSDQFKDVFAEYQSMISRDGTCRITGLPAGRYEISRMKRIRLADIGRHVRLDLKRVTITANEDSTVRFEQAKGPTLSGRLEVMADEKLVAAMITFRKMDDQTKEKSMNYIEADEAVVCQENGSFQTGQLATGRYKWTLSGYRTNPNPEVLTSTPRIPDYSRSGEVIIDYNTSAALLIIR